MSRATYMRFVKTISSGCMKGVTRLIEIDNPAPSIVDSYQSAQRNGETLFDGVNSYSVNHMVVE